MVCLRLQMQKLTLLVMLMAVLVLAASVRTEEEEKRSIIPKYWRRWLDTKEKTKSINFSDLPSNLRGSRSLDDLIDVIETEEISE